MIVSPVFYFKVSAIRLTCLAGGNMAAKSPRILSLEHSENTLTGSNAGELTVSGAESGSQVWKKNIYNWVTVITIKNKFNPIEYLRRITGDRGSSLDIDGVWLRLGDSSVSWVTNFFFLPSSVFGWNSGRGAGGDSISFTFLSCPDGLV